ncbi:MAG: hypothetical protein MPL62_06105 [Alphaproteobacteria bacterium]|nr:hypothetical protein [Alphaproteobacteria bacterium]
MDERRPIRVNRRSASGISGRLTKTFTLPAQASAAHRWLAALPPKN